MKRIRPNLPKEFSKPEVPTDTQVELLLACVAEQPVRLTRQQQAAAAVSDWNVVYATVGSFADGHCTL